MYANFFKYFVLWIYLIGNERASLNVLTLALLIALAGSLESLVIVWAATLLHCRVPVAIRRENSMSDIRCNHTHNINTCIKQRANCIPICSTITKYVMCNIEATTKNMDQGFVLLKHLCKLYNYAINFDLSFY